MIQRTDIIWLAEVDSTNRFALDNFRWFESGTMIAASAQSAGYGTKGRSWLSPPDVNVYASLVLRDFPFPVHSAARIGSLAVLRVLRMHEPGLPLSVKWPNDILCGHKKIAGVLCETRDNGLVIGIGININLDQADLDLIDQPAASLRSLSGRESDVKALTAVLAEKLAVFYQQYLTAPDRLFEEWRSHNRIIGRTVTLTDPAGASHRVLVRGITSDGELDVEENGTAFRFNCGDVVLCKEDMFD